MPAMKSTSIEEPLIDQILSRTMAIIEPTGLFNANQLDAIKQLINDNRLSNHEAILKILTSHEEEHS